MFSKVSLFSGLNNLEDISLDPRSGALCDYTDEDIDTVLHPNSMGSTVIRYALGIMATIGAATNGFIIRLMCFCCSAKREFHPHWFVTGSPNFLFEMLKANSISPIELKGRIADQSLIYKFDVNDINIEALMFQTGYLTITEERQLGNKTL